VALPGRTVFRSAGAALIFLLALEAWAFAGEPAFYGGKTVTVIEGRRPGGLGSARTQVVSKYLQKHLSGKPSMVYQYMPAGAGLAAANHMAGVAKRDGLTIGNVGTALYSNAVFGETGVRYKLDDFTFLGSASLGGPYGLVIRSALGIDSVDKLKGAKGIRFANRAVGHSLYILDRLMAWIFELNDPRWVLGLGDDEIYLAMERGEADARVHNLHVIVQERSRWLQGGYTFPAGMKNPRGKGPEVVPGFSYRPRTIDQYADTELKRAVLGLHNATRAGGSIFFVPRGIPEPVLKELRGAFDRIWSDPEFAEEYPRVAGEPLDPITGDEIEQVIGQMPQDPKVTEVYKQLIGGGPLPAAR
jgi:tripartite-type tricarboxylate transporter receptor subunit TctC